MVRSNSTGERRQLTLMFCDLVGSTALSERLDPEDLRDVLVAYREAATRTAIGNGGSIVNYAGDGIMFAFGYPRAHEDDAARAVHAALRLIEETTRLGTKAAHVAQEAIAVRIGIHTGLVIAGELRAGNTVESVAVVGEAPNVVARLQEMAEPNTVIISGATFDLVEGLFDCEDLGFSTLKGLSRPIRLHRVQGESAAPNRLAARALRGLTPMIGRDDKLEQLLVLWAQARTGNLAVAALSGEPGVGKSRLVAEIERRAAAEGAACIELRCSPFYENSALYPVIAYLKNVLDFSQLATPEERLDRIRGALTEADLPLGEMDHLLAALLDVPASLPPALSSNPQLQKQKTREMLIEWLRAAQREGPLLLIVEDVHWADPSTRELIAAACIALADTKLFIVLVHRQGHDTAWMDAHKPTRLALSRLTRPEIAAVVEHVAKGLALPQAIVDGLVERADGIPLFAEELTKTVVETSEAQPIEDQGPDAVRQMTIPATLQDSLTARLDRLAGSRDVVQLASTIGREFDYALLAAAWTSEESKLLESLRELVESGLLHQVGELPQATFVFKHALIQDTAYQSMLRSKRRGLHQAVADCLATRFPDVVIQSPEVLALHYTEAGAAASAAPRWHEAAECALRRSAHVEAHNHVRKGLDLLASLPDGPARDQLELALLIDLGVCLTATRGYAFADVGETFARAREICRRMEKTPRIAAVLHGLYRYYFVRGEAQTSLDLGHELLSIGKELKEDMFVLEAHRTIGNSHMLLSELAPARLHLKASIDLYESATLRKHWSQYGVVMDPAVAAKAMLAMTLWLQGFAQQADDVMNQTVAMAREHAHPFGLAWAMNYAAVVSQMRGEPAKVGDAVAACIAVAREHHFPFWIAGGSMIKGWYLNRVAPANGEGVELLRDGLKTWRGIGAAAFLPYFMSLLAESLGDGGDIKGGLAVVTEAMEQAATSGEIWWLPELHRLKGELLLRGARPDARGAQACFETALDLAQRCEARGLELRAAASYHRLMRGTPRGEVARHRLADVFGSFSEGFDTVDWQAANLALHERDDARNQARGAASS